VVERTYYGHSMQDKKGYLAEQYVYKIELHLFMNWCKMSLETVINEKTIKKRHFILSNYLKNNNVGVLNENETLWFKHIFEKFYTPDDQYTKFNSSQISNVSIVKDNYGNKCFCIFVNDTRFPTSIKRLAGGNRNDKANVIRALRNAIEPQIHDFRKNNPLNPVNICPITNEPFGFDAEVDHQIPFHMLEEEWIKNNKNISYIYNVDKFDYILQEPYYTRWFNFHLEKSILRWVSKEGNKIAHKLYVKTDCLG